jgi:predicted GNAT family N-acyltransferase
MGRVELIRSEETYMLRQLVLRPTLSIDQVAMDHDETKGTFHVGAMDEAGEVVAIMTVMRDCVPGTESQAWRIRGMASHPESRGNGLGGAVLKFGLAHALAISKDTVWCNARRVAYGFYERYGFRIVGEEFDIAGIGPHKVMVLGEE